MLSLLAPSSVDALASSTAANPTTPLTASMSSPAAPPVVGTSSTAAAATTSPLPSIRRRRGRLFLSHLFQYIALAYEYICSFLHLRQRRVEPAKVVTASYNNSPPTRTAKRKSQSIPKDPKVSAALQYYKGKTLVLDLDETLVHSVRLGSFASKQPVSNSIKRKKIEVQDDKQSLLYEVYKRPHVDFFLKTISQWYKVVIFTASLAEYADPVIDWLDQDHNVISQRYFRQSCVVRNGNFVKDISLAEPDLAKVCLVDNSTAAFELFEENGIPLPGWVSNPNDECLLDLLPLLDALRFTADVRSILRLRRIGMSC
ncbi:hypothetical protein VTP01DRAFT_470 [Rhizomucor pusillus]|uniref:uncharacterized protein n=1 Tax=Rhizomucor pusillus TaxID=4840 RepID=UPI003743E7D6